MDLHYKYDGTDDHMDSRDIEEDIVQIESDFELDYEVHQGPSDFAATIRQQQRHEGEDEGLADIYEAIHSLRNDAARANEGWEYGIQFVRAEAADGDWAAEKARDWGVFQRGNGYGYDPRAETEDLASQWPFTHIDWQAAADALHEDAQTFEFQGTTYFED